MEIDLDEIRKTVAIKHDLLIGEDDPLMVMVTMNGELLEQCVRVLNAQQDKNLKALLDALKQGNIEAKATAGRVITEAAGYVSDQVNVAVTAAMSESEDRIRQKFTNYLKAMGDMTYDAQTTKRISLVAAGVSVICAVATLGAMLVT